MKTQEFPVYKRPVAGESVTTILYKAVKTPKLKVKFSNVVNPFFYPNSPTVARWSITCLLDPDKDKEFISKVEGIELKEHIKNSLTLKDDVCKDAKGVVKTGKYIMKFQTRDKIPVIVVKPGFPQVPAHLSQEIAFGDKVIIVFDVVKYTKKGMPNDLTRGGISYQPTLIYLYPYEGQESNHDEIPA